MSILSLDLASKTGWCFLCSKRDAYDGGVVVFKGERVNRLVELRLWLRQFAREDLLAVVYERPFARGRAATRSAWGMAGVVESVFGDKCAVLDVEVNTLKKWAGGAGKGKGPTLAKCRELGIEPIDDNHADAVCLAHYAAEKIVVTSRDSKKERK